MAVGNGSYHVTKKKTNIIPSIHLSNRDKETLVYIGDSGGTCFFQKYIYIPYRRMYRGDSYIILIYIKGQKPDHREHGGIPWDGTLQKINYLKIDLILLLVFNYM